MNDNLDVIVQYRIGDSEEEYTLNIPHLPVKVGDSVEVNIQVQDKAYWTPEPSHKAFVVEEVSYYVQEVFGHKGWRKTISIQTLYLKETHDFGKTRI